MACEYGWIDRPSGHKNRRDTGTVYLRELWRKAQYFGDRVVGYSLAVAVAEPSAPAIGWTDPELLPKLLVEGDRVVLTSCGENFGVFGMVRRIVHFPDEVSISLDTGGFECFRFQDLRNCVELVCDSVGKTDFPGTVEPVVKELLPSSIELVVGEAATKQEPIEIQRQQPIENSTAVEVQAHEAPIIETVETNPSVKVDLVSEPIIETVETNPGVEVDRHPIVRGVTFSDRFLARYWPPQPENIHYKADVDGQLSLLDFEVESADEPPDPDDFALFPQPSRVKQLPINNAQ